MIDKKNRPKAVVGVMVFKNDKVLIGRRTENASHGPGEYSFPGGHIEEGESFKETVERETFEEAGIKVKNLKFLSVANINTYKDHQGILVSFVADWESGEPRTLSDENIGEWQWSDLSNLPKPLFIPTEILIDSYKSGKNYYDKD